MRVSMLAGAGLVAAHGAASVERRRYGGPARVPAYDHDAHVRFWRWWQRAENARREREAAEAARRERDQHWISAAEEKRARRRARRAQIKGGERG